jgi:NAD(P)H-dependent FMN reductase
MHISSHALPRVAVVIGSNRPRRICTGIATWAQRALSDTGLLEVELVDLQQLDLPFLDEPIMASRGHYEHEHTARWSGIVRSYDGFVFVFPQYNWGYPAVLKNALDFLYHEWANKPAGLVTYGTRGGGLAATQLKQVLQGLHMRSTETNIELKTNETLTSDDGNFHDIDAAFADYRPQATGLASELNHLVNGRD